MSTVYGRRTPIFLPLCLGSFQISSVKFWVKKFRVVLFRIVKIEISSIGDRMLNFKKSYLEINLRDPLHLFWNNQLGIVLRIYGKIMAKNFLADFRSH
jgi:hypothetical protein